MLANVRGTSPQPAKLFPSGFGSGERCPGALTDGLSLVLCDHCHNADGHGVGFQQIGGNELDATVAKGHEESNVA
jgi:hypothetical protein